MLKNQEEYLNYLTEIQDHLSKSSIKSEAIENFNIGILKKNITERELTIPIIGAFSSGKSTLINSFLNNTLLPVNITPETSLATEIRYSTEERVEAVKADSSIETFSLGDMSSITQNASMYKYLKFYINNEKVKSIEPIIIVDMPGFDSPLDLHNQAIMEYINRGVHYIILTSVEDGNITRSMERQLSDIQEYERDFSFFLSKSDLKHGSDVEEITSKIEEQITEYFDVEKKVVSIGKDSGANLKNVLANLDTEKLFSNLFKDSLKDNYMTISDYVNTTLAAFKKDNKENDLALTEVKKGLEKLLVNKQRMIAEANDKYSNSKINTIVEAVGRDITNSSSELVSAAISGGGDAMSGIISEILRHSLIQNIQSSIRDIGNDVIDDFSIDLSKINGVISDFSVSDDWVEKITTGTKSLLNSANGGLNNLVEKTKSKDGSKALYKTLTTVLAVTTGVIAPILEIVIIFLPELLAVFFSKYKEKKQEDQVRSSIMQQLIPSIKRELRSKLPVVFQKQVEELILNIGNEFETKLKEKEIAIEDAKKEKTANIANIDKKIEEYSFLNETITKLANEILYK